MFVALSQFEVANGMAEPVREAFRNRPRQVETAPGFVRMEVLQPQETPDLFWLLTFWRDEASFRNWRHSHAYHEAHTGIPRGLKLVRGSTMLRFLELICE